MTTHQEQRHTVEHYRTLATGQVVHVADYHSGHEIANRSRQAELHERTAIGLHSPSGKHYLRATNAKDLMALRAHADRLGIAYTQRRAGANHHGRQGAYEHLDFGTLDEAGAVLAATSPGSATAPPVPAQAPVAATSPALPAATVSAGTQSEDPLDHNEQFSRIFGGRLDIPTPEQAEVNTDFAALFGNIDPVGTGMFGANPIPQAEPLTRVKADEVTRSLQAKGQRVTFSDEFIQTWNQECKTDLTQYMEDCFGAWGAGLRLGFTASGKTIHINGAQPGKIITLTRTFHLGDAKKWVHHDYLKLEDSIKGTNYAEPFLTKSMDYYRAWNVNFVDVCAALDGGGYAWSRYGFVPKTNTDWVWQAEAIGANLNRFDPAAKVREYEAKRAEAQRSGNTGKEKAMARKVAEASECVALMAKPAKVDEFRALLAKTDRFTQWQVSSHPFGQFLMPGTSFSGIFVLGDKPHLNRMLEYVAGRKARREAQ